MKKKLIVIVIIVSAAILIGSYFILRPEKQGEISRTCCEAETGAADVSFFGETGEIIKFSFCSDVKGGELNIILYDSNGNAVCEIDKAKELEDFYTLENTDTYTLSAEYTDFIGDFKVMIFKKSEVTKWKKVNYEAAGLMVSLLPDFYPVKAAFGGGCKVIYFPLQQTVHSSAYKNVYIKIFVSISVQFAAAESIT